MSLRAADLPAETSFSLLPLLGGKGHTKLDYCGTPFPEGIRFEIRVKKLKTAVPRQQRLVELQGRFLIPHTPLLLFMPRMGKCIASTNNPRRRTSPA